MTINREDQRFWDTRTLERRVRKGLLTRKDIDKHLRGLPDSADKSEKLGLSDSDDDDSDE